MHQFFGGELPLSLKNEVFKNQGIKNSLSFLSVPPLPPHVSFYEFI